MTNIEDAGLSFYRGSWCAGIGLPFMPVSIQGLGLVSVVPVGCGQKVITDNSFRCTKHHELINTKKCIFLFAEFLLLYKLRSPNLLKNFFYALFVRKCKRLETNNPLQSKVLIQFSRTSLFMIDRLKSSDDILLCNGTNIKIVIIQSKTIIKRDPNVKIERSLNVQR